MRTQEIIRWMRAVVCAGALACGGPARVLAQEAEPPGLKSPTTARALSAIGVAAPIALGFAIGEAGRGVGLGAGVVLGPVLGYAYAGQTRRGMEEVGIRALVAGATAAGVTLLCLGGGCEVSIGGSDDDDALAAAVILGAAGVVTTTAMALIDVSRVGDRVRARYEELRRVSLRPAYFPESRTPGVLVVWRPW